MAQGQQWSYVFPKDKDKLKFYFLNKQIDEDDNIYIRILTVNKATYFMQCFQMSGRKCGFCSLRIDSDDIERKIKKDFPFIRTLNTYNL